MGDEGQDALAKFVYLRPPLSLASIADGLKFMEGPLLDSYMEACAWPGWNRPDLTMSQSRP
jgi:hypothetical protein